MTCDVAIVGAGPAGLAAATQAAGLGLDTLLLDEQPEPGGQMYRAIESVRRTRASDLDILGQDYADGAALVASFRTSGSRYLPGSVVWQVREDGCVGLSCNGTPHIVAARRVVIATGAMERPVQVPGWSLPRVMNAGAVPTLLKGSGVVPDGPVVLLGSGRLLSQVAAQLARADVLIAAVLHIGPEVSATESGLIATEIYGVSQPVIQGTTQAEAVSYTHGGKRHRTEASLVLLHNGLIPCTQLSLGAGCKQIWNAEQRYWQPWTDEWGATNLERIAVAGDGSGTCNAPVAACQGTLAALDAAMRLGKLSQTERDEMARTVCTELAHYRAVNPPTAPAAELLAPIGADDIVCQCESVTVAELQDAIAQGSSELNAIKAFTRCGMGLCQGRLCGPVAAEVIARALGQSVEQVGQFRVRLPVRPLPLAELANLK